MGRPLDRATVGDVEPLLLAGTTHLLHLQNLAGPRPGQRMQHPHVPTTIDRFRRRIAHPRLRAGNRTGARSVQGHIGTGPGGGAR